MRFLVALVILAALTIWIASGDEFTFEQVGYFKGENSNRVFQLVAPEGAGAADVQQAAAGKSHTDGRNTIVYVYPHGAAAVDLVTLAATYPAANAAVYDAGGYLWVYSRAPNGAEVFKDCAAGGCP